MRPAASVRGPDTGLLKWLCAKLPVPGMELRHNTGVGDESDGEVG